VRIADVMTRNVITVRPETTLKEAAGLLARTGISGMPVVDGTGAVVGVFSEADILFKERGERTEGGLLRWLLEPSATWEDAKLEAQTVGEAMTAPALTIEPDRPVREAAARMIAEGVNRLPVVDGAAQLVGIVTRADLVRAFTRSDEEIAKEIETDIVRRTLWIDPGNIQVRVENGAVTLDGQVETATDAELLPVFVQRVPGVVAVESNVTHREHESATR